ncbi:U32 family peptidase [Clostridium polynesiense]|uniref:U32 family peptidase n=1 Tax=Clostridium polynesiense TaxID=1325933 RepID=UPI00058C18EF|nr:U32 family peptidase [Clostridium polynesiense]
MKDKIELLAPAGNMECFMAAVNAGADAVYIGGDKFSARAYAGNFDMNNIKKALEYAHIRGKKVYITLNTLIKENEMKEAEEYIEKLYAMGADALIIQDTGLAYYISNAYPDLEIHASTQMTVHNAEAAEYLVNKGFKRIVLSRELSLKEIKHISLDLNIETEIFVHGALCVSYSGQCLMSSLIGGRSGNRGRCAQACRMPYSIINKETDEYKSGYLLSPKDMCTIDIVEDIIKSGTASLKIEGRMKRAEYVAGVVKNYREAIDSYYGLKENSDVEGAKTELMQLFNREGFNKSYLYGNPGIELMAVNNPKNTGIVLGRVNKDLSVTLENDIALKDGVTNGDTGFTVTKIIEYDSTLEEAFKGSRVKLFPPNYKKGDVLYKTSSEKLNNKYKTYTYADNFKKEKININFIFSIDKPFTLSAEYKGKNYEVSGDMVQKAINKPTELNRIYDNLSKSGDSPFQVSKVSAQDYEEGFLPVSSINKSRRELLEKIEEDMLKSFERKGVKQHIKAKEYKRFEGNPDFLAVINTKEQLKAFLHSSIEAAAVNLFWRRNGIREEDLISISEKDVYLKIPNIIRQEYKSLIKIIERNLNNIKGIVTSNLGIINRFKGRTAIIGDYKSNIFNSYSTDFYNEELKSASISVELNKKEIQEIVHKSSIPLQALIYGKIEMMVMEYCPIGSVMGNKSTDRNCGRECEKGNYVLKDRLNKEFPVYTDLFCRSILLNTIPLNLIDRQKELKEIGIKSFRVDFTDENYEETYKILEMLKEKASILIKDEATRGHYKRGVE